MLKKNGHIFSEKVNECGAELVALATEAQYLATDTAETGIAYVFTEFTILYHTESEGAGGTKLCGEAITANLSFCTDYCS